ncbi:hypothetical protein MKX03_009061 [Papaver bracteatum]|nr:hypothetical protein MKX03_009061 [Papaver bracteatum]
MTLRSNADHHPVLRLRGAKEDDKGRAIFRSATERWKGRRRRQTTTLSRDCEVERMTEKANHHSERKTAKADHLLVPRLRGAKEDGEGRPPLSLATDSGKEDGNGRPPLKFARVMYQTKRFAFLTLVQ